MKRIYLDYAASYTGDSKAFYHQEGLRARVMLETAREEAAKLLGVSSEEITFYPTHRVANNVILQGIKGKRVTIATEPNMILDNCDVVVSVDKNGIANLNQLEKEARGAAIISASHANMETGTTQDIKKISEIAKKNKALFHLDVSQSLGLEEFNIKDVDLLTFSGRHIGDDYALVYVKKGVKLEPLLKGKDDENPIAARALVKNMRVKRDAAKLAKLRNKLVASLLKISDSWLNGVNTVPSIANIAFKNIEGESIATMLDMEGVAVSTGSACASQGLKPSHVLLAMGQKAEDAHGSIRFSLNEKLKETDIDHVLDVMPKIVKRLRELSPLK